MKEIGTIAVSDPIDLLVFSSKTTLYAAMLTDLEVFAKIELPSDTKIE